ncbi:uncharacterized protein LOC109542486 [Dendroctonus ponderosae]|uniref:Protein Abitram n=1 Tax=Dendroctonus ponderosae TaxID=77166 RepID=U4UL99_DENPD|nr:uncharacterized protein LOC109542486 [Dendroctonus ponderosae]ERL93877.1 hypothetical protein D910_11163 [Dendroctonus ponderosae]
MNSDLPKNIAESIEALSVPILESISKEEIEGFKPYYERYYENKYCTIFNTDTENNDILLRFHTNRLILVSIAAGHDIFRHKKTIESIDFNVNGTNMLDISISGKKKAGAKKLKKNSVLCFIKCKDDDKQYPVCSCIPASLIEVNHLVLDKPQLLISSYKEFGFIGVLYPQRSGPKASSIDKMFADLKLHSESEYQQYLGSRREATEAEIVP